MRAILAAALLLASSDAAATIFKCVDATGKQTYQQKPCPQTTQESKVNAGPAWKLIKYETYFDENSKKVGALVRVQFKQSVVSQYDGRDASHQGYVYYNCASRSIAGPYFTQFHGRAQRIELSRIETGLLEGGPQSEMSSFENFKRRGDRSAPFAEDEFVEVACASAAPASAGSSVLMGSGPEREVYAATPQGVTVNDISVDGDWVTISGVAKDTRSISDFMRNLSAGAFDSPSISKVAAGDFEIKARLRAR